MMGTRLREAFEGELKAAHQAAETGDGPAIWAHLERAHILGQRSTRAHVRSHVEMLCIAWRGKDVREIFGQLIRILGASVLSRIWIPEGNTGRSNVSAFRAMPIPADLQRLLDANLR